MKGRRYNPLCAIGLLLLVALPSRTIADVSPGDVLDRSNYEKAEGLLPSSVLAWIKKGDLVAEVQELTFDSSEYFAPPAKERLQENIGKYDLDEHDTIIEAKTGAHPDYIEGIPFPKPDLNDPKAGAKIMQNQFYYKYTQGNLRFPFQAAWIGPSGFEREVVCAWRVLVLVGYPGAKELSNRNGVERYGIIQVISPFDIAGTNVLLWRYLDERADSSFSYVPAIRRVRRMSPANRSDAFIGLDLSVDDAYGFDGKVGTFEWKLLGKQEALLPFVGNRPGLLEPADGGQWQSAKSVKRVVYGYEKEGSQTAPWMPTNLAWIKREAYVIEMKPKDPYYNYGPQYMWVDAENFWCCYKIIHDRAGQYWKTFWVAEHPLESADKQLHWIGTGTHDMVDDRRQHASFLRCISPENQFIYYAVEDRNDYSLAGFQKLCK